MMQQHSAGYAPNTGANPPYINNIPDTGFRRCDEYFLN